MTNGEQYTVGMRVRIRDAEWFIRKTEPMNGGGQALYVRGITSPVQGRDQIFWSLAEPDGIEIIRPENTQLTLDTSAHAIRTRLRIESVARHNPISESAITISRRAAMDVMNYQLVPAYHALNSERDPRARILIADAVGLGKTLEAGILLSELMVRGAAKRILVVTLKSMMAQFQKEMWCRFSIPLVRLDSVGLQRIRSDIPSHHNPFNYYDKTIVSVDTLKQDNQFRSALNSSRWDVIVIDEAHNVAARGRAQRAQRARLAAELAMQCDHMILLSATPHDGSKESFASLMTLLDPLAIPDPKKYTANDISGLFERRFKKDVADEIARHFPERELVPIEAGASLPEVALYNALNEATFVMDARRRKGDMVFKTTLIKSLLSSPAAFIKTAENRIHNVATSPDDIPTLQNLLDLASQIGRADFSKYQNLVQNLRDKKTGWKKSAPNDRIVIFTERIETERFLVENLAADLGLKPNTITSIDGHMKDTEIMSRVEDFGLPNSPLRILIASDVASEGINLHYCSHRLYHFDIPWSLITFQQRNGRIDRYGQDQKPIITFMLSSVDGKRDDLNVLRHIVNREIAAHDNIGDPGQLMGVYDANEEENIVARAYQAVADGQDVISALDEQIAAAQHEEHAEDASTAADGGEFDLLSLLAGDEDTAFGEDAGTGASSRVPTADIATIFPQENDYLTAGMDFMRSISQRSFGSITRDERSGLYEIDLAGRANENLRTFCRHVLPYELRRLVGNEGKLRFTTDAKVMQEETRNARAQARLEDGESTMREVWPDVSYLWPLSPVSEWVTDNVNATFGSQSAPVLKVPGGVGLDGRLGFLILGQVPNEHGEPLVQKWYFVSFGTNADPDVRTGRLDELISPFGLTNPRYANGVRDDETLAPEVADRLNSLRLPALEAIRSRLDDAVAEFETATRPVNEKRMRALDERYDKGVHQLEFAFEQYEESVKVMRRRFLDTAKEQRKAALENFKLWVKTHREPTSNRDCQIVAAFVCGR